MTSLKLTNKLERHRSLCHRRDAWKPLWQELADVLYPNRGAFTREQQEGQETQHELYDSTPQQARRGLATAIDGLMKPSSAKWFWLRATADDLNELDEVKYWLEECQRRMWTAIYNPQARFIQHSGAVDNDLAAFGLGYIWISENRDRNGLLFRSLHINDCAIDENADGQIDTIYVSRKWTARQVMQRFGDATPTKIKESLVGAQAEKDKDKLWEIVVAVEPRHEYDPRSRHSNLHFPYSNCVFWAGAEGNNGDGEIIEESGFQEFPVAIPRWEVAPNEVYPRSPGMLALPDARTLQAMGMTLLAGGQLAVDPPRWVPDDGMMSTVRTYPGGINVVDAEVVKATRGRPMGTLELGANMPIGREMQIDYRQMVEAAFFKNIFNLPVEGPDMTATEVIERKEEFIRTIGPVLGQLEMDYVGNIIHRVFGIMSGPHRDFVAAALPPPPEALLGQEVKFEFQSPIQQARKRLEVANMARAFEFLTPLITIDPGVVANFDSDEIVRDMPEAFSLPAKWLRPKDEVEQLRAQQQQAQQGQAAIVEGQGVADIVDTVASAGQSAAQATAAQQPQQ
jgi:hypothetical protein